jgi:hypothetical protein
MSFVKKTGSILKSSPFLYRLGLNVYNVFFSFYKFLLNTWLKFIEFLLPQNYFIQNVPDFAKTTYKDFLKDQRLYNKKQEIYKRDGNRIVNSKYLLEMVYNLPEGDYAELGTYKGTFAHFIFKYKNSAAKLYCFDTFEGFAKKDVEIEKDKINLEVKEGFFADTCLDKVRENILGKGNQSESLKLVKGYFPESFKGYENLKWRFVLLDADLYEPIKEGVKIFWPKIVNGGILMIHDYYGSYSGTKKAADEYFEPLGIKPVPLGDKGGTGIVINRMVN